MPPSRVVDGHHQGWRWVDGEIYEADYGFMRDLPNQTLDELRRHRGPVRPVKPVTAADKARLAEIFGVAGRKTVTTLAAALEEVWHRSREHHGGLHNPAASSDAATRALTAGREGSWESQALRHLVTFGNGLNLAPAKRGQDNSVTALRQAGPSKRVDRAAKQAAVEVLTTWITDPNRYTEVAETLALSVSQFADHIGADGWKAIADQWLQPTSSLSRDDFTACYRLLYSQSRYFDPTLL
jgi:hypothetical protein